MSAQHSLLERFEIEQDAPEEPGEFESIEAALLELNDAYARHTIDFRRLTERRDELLTRKAILRRSRARQALDAVYPPVIFISIEQGEQTIAQREAHLSHLTCIAKEKARKRARELAHA